MLTAVWDGSPIRYLQELAASVLGQNQDGATAWVIAANGCRRPELVAYLQELETVPGVDVVWSETNLGIVGGLRLCLEHAQSRYILPVDADDLLYPDALAIVASHIRQQSYPPLLYSDEDKVAGSAVYQPYFKSNWDPVLLANSAYIAHLGVIDRQLALELDAYGDRGSEGSPDWDLFMRFAAAGYTAVHIPEVVYSWRIHASSTAEDAATKPYIVSSQQAVLERFRQQHPSGAKFTVEPSPLFGPNAAHLRLARRPGMSNTSVTIVCLVDLPSLKQAAERLASREGFVALSLGQQSPTWLSDALGLFELFPDTVMVGGVQLSPTGQILDGPRIFGFGNGYGSPDSGRRSSDPGYFGQLWKERSASAVPSAPALVRTSTLIDTLAVLPPDATITNLGCWIGAEARSRHERIVYSPYLREQARSPTDASRDLREQDVFRDRYRALMPDRRYYPEPLSLCRAYRIDL